MAGSGAAQRKEMGARPKEPKARGHAAHNLAQVAASTGNRGRRCPHKLVQSDKDGASEVKKGSGKYTSEVDSKMNGHLPVKREKLPCVVQSSTNSPRGTEKSNKNHFPIEASRKQNLNTTSAKGDKGTSSCNDTKLYVLQLPEQETNKKFRDQPSIKLSHPKYKDDMQASKKKGPAKAKIEEKHKTNGLFVDYGDVKDPKEKDVKTANSRSPRGLKDIVNGKLRMKMDDISKAAEKVNKVVNTILKSDAFRGDSLFRNITKLCTGSYYEHVKISKPNEFDIMLKISLESYNTIKPMNIDGKGPFYTLAFKDRYPISMEKYLDDEKNILARKIVDEFRNLIRQIIPKTELEEVSLQRKDPGSPAVTLTIKNEPVDISVDLVLALKLNSRWPVETNDGMNIDEWLGAKAKQELKRTNLHMVPKQAKVGKKTMDIDTWRISFSEIEKKILTNHGNGKTCCENGGSKSEKCCRKQCLKLMKYLLELLKKNGKQRQMTQFCSYHAKTALLHLCAKNPKDEDWKLENLEDCFTRYISYFQDCLKDYNLPNFFIPSHNLFSDEYVDKSNCDFLCKEIEKQRKSNYPIFYE
ncbi:hypothetical protein GDO81_007885 [Engystomops pustulosus]|uniref:Cyclic GMP-AMP synthase n=2 Tax=Engystomops pustulosus TaxID=76066 RepID=A0AAV7CAG0_ENGPU|nr:hypothetical protein GDO81_007885 [Engystomops pustulosus]